MCRGDTTRSRRTRSDSRTRQSVKFCAVHLEFGTNRLQVIVHKATRATPWCGGARRPAARGRPGGSRENPDPVLENIPSVLDTCRTDAHRNWRRALRDHVSTRRRLETRAAVSVGSLERASGPYGDTAEPRRVFEI